MLPEGKESRSDRQGPSSDPSSGLSDEDCFVLAGSGSRSAQEEIVARYTPRMYNLFSRVLGDRDLAADATQESFLRVFRDPGAFRAQRSFRSWIFAIAWNHARDLLRRRAVRRRMLAGEPETHGDVVDRRAHSPAEILEVEERAAIVRSALDRLDPRHRALLVLRDMEGLSYDEIAELSSTSLGTIKSGIHRARLELKQALSRGGAHGL